MNTDGLNEIAESVRGHLDAKHQAREQALTLSREVVRLSANAIRAVHRREFTAAEGLLDKARDNLKQTRSGLAQHADIFHAGFVHDAQKEFAEAHTTLAFIAGRPLPTPDDLGVMGASYLNGLGETVGELAATSSTPCGPGTSSTARSASTTMSDIYDVLVTMDYPEAVTSGLRRTADAMRGILERTRGDFTTSFVQARLEERLRDLEQRLPG